MLTKFIPDMIVDTIHEIDFATLKQRGFNTVITDLDNTLVGAKVPLATSQLVTWLHHLDEQGWKVVIVSNNNLTRVSSFAKPLELPYVHNAHKPRNKAFLKALKLVNATPAQAVMVGDQLMTDVLGGNRLGLHTIWVKPIAIQDEGFFTKINRRMEKFVISKLRRKGHALFKEDL